MGRHHSAALALIALLIASCGNDADGDGGAETGPTAACPVCAIPQYSCSHTRPIESAFLRITEHSATGCSGDLQGSPIVFDCEKQEACFPDCRPFVFEGTGMTIGDTISCGRDDGRP